MTNKEIKELLTNQRVAGIDYGLKRVGLAVSDELHITASPRKFYINDDKFLSQLYDDLKFDNIKFVVVGYPMTYNTEGTEFHREIDIFIEELKLNGGLTVFTYDESYSSKEAVGTMIGSGKKKSKRSSKGETDKVAAAIILRNFLNELDY